ncbi:cell cycle checkpoint protein [Aspergillus karnatakaensis]|uniref:checkpoint protein HUS1 family protein n=1 Tax=Aspergillus karnatakaensis TaxID=1810916 RepID=UPI003CCD5C84
MRFRTQVVNTATLTKLVGSLSSLGKLCWMRLEESVVRFTIIPDQGTQVWAQLPVESIFEDTDYTLESNTGVINLEVPLSSLHRALRSAANAKWVQLRLTQRGKVPFLALTIRAKSWVKGSDPLGVSNGPATVIERDDGSLVTETRARGANPTTEGPGSMGPPPPPGQASASGRRERETFITQEIPVKVLHESAVEGLHEPRCRDPDVHIILPDLFQLKSISERFTKLAADSSPAAAAAAANSNIVSTQNSGATSGPGTLGPGASPKLELSANMHGSLRLAIATDALRISSVWSDLHNPALDPSQLSQSQMDQLPSERMRALPGDDEAGWAKVRIDGRDWARVLSVGRLNPKVVACFIHETALVLYVYLPSSWNEDEESCLTYYINSYLN